MMELNQKLLKASIPRRHSIQGVYTRKYLCNNFEVKERGECLLKEGLISETCGPVMPGPHSLTRKRVW